MLPAHFPAFFFSLCSLLFAALALAHVMRRV
jgi:hypothetical protein